MDRMKKLLAIALMAMVLGVGTPAVFADGPSETPGIIGPSETPGKNDGPSETPGQTGPSETPGRMMIEIIVYLATNLVA